jgi:hypothetical protein
MLQEEPPWQLVPHVPQWSELVLRSTHAPPQLDSPAPQVDEHTPFVHTLPPAQTIAQPPQWLGSVRGSTQAPPHSIWLWGQPQVPPLHTWSAAQLMPQAPQSASALLRSTQLPLQAVSPGPHARAHRPELQTWPPVQALSQAPQFIVSEVTSTHMAWHVVWPAEQTRLGASIPPPSVPAFPVAGASAGKSDAAASRGGPSPIAPSLEF